MDNQLKLSTNQIYHLSWHKSCFLLRFFYLKNKSSVCMRVFVLHVVRENLFADMAIAKTRKPICFKQLI